MGTKCTALGLLFLAGSIPAADVAVLRGKQSYPVEEQQIRTVAEHYGLGFKTADIASPEALPLLKSPGTIAVITSGDALHGLNRWRISAALRRPGSRAIPMLVLGIAGGEDAKELKRWSGGAVQGCTPRADGTQPKTLEVGDVPALSGPLSGHSLPAAAWPACNMQLGAAAQTVLASRGDTGTTPTLIRTRTVAEVFFAPRMQMFDTRRGIREELPKAFTPLAPFFVFLHYAAGDYGWRLDGQYANLTIDDPWLRQPYGRLDYFTLLAEMKKHKFHTTIAFVPWNFDRSEPAVVELFRKYPAHFSICLHGNDHVHREFGDYSRNSLPDQVADVKQAVARMERFKVLTGLAYDRFMVFPHGVAPEKTFEVLKRYDFLATANSENVPLGGAAPAGPEVLFRTYTSAYAAFPSLLRYPATGPISQLEIAIESFFGNPLLFYGHEGLFATGAEAFNRLADAVNAAQPDTRWRSLGEIARHLHLIRRRDTGGFDVNMSSNEMDLANPTDENAAFHICRGEPAPDTIRSLTVDGKPAPFRVTGTRLELRILIPARQIAKVRIAYHNDLDVPRQDIGKHRFYATVLRRVSDFRDLYLSQSRIGRFLTESYYGRGLNRVQEDLERMWPLAAISGALVIALGTALVRRRWIARRRRAPQKGITC